MIKLIDIEKIYQTKTIETVALSSINLEVNKGEFISVMGPSGSGKSTLLNVIGLLDAPSQGQVFYEDLDPNDFRDSQLADFRNRKIGFIFQSFHLINDLPVYDNVELPLLYRKMKSSERKKRVLEALEKVELGNRVDHYPGQLSGGQNQRVAIARAIVGQPEVLLADEPTGNLDSQMGSDIMNILLNLNREEGTTIVMVTHDENLAKMTNRLLRLFDGRQVA